MRVISIFRGNDITAKIVKVSRGWGKLKYYYLLRSTPALDDFASQHLDKIFRFLVEDSGIEPLTPTLQK